MNITYACPRCDEGVRQDVSPATENLACPHCGVAIDVPADAFAGGQLRRCLVCPSTDLFVRKDFPQRLGVGLVVIGFAASCVAWAMYLPYWTFGILFGTVLIDVLLYALVGNAVMCYRCHSQYRGVDNLEDFAAFELETHERYRQQEARMTSV